jgi:hypothetical protein
VFERLLAKMWQVAYQYGWDVERLPWSAVDGGFRGRKEWPCGEWSGVQVSIWEYGLHGWIRDDRLIPADWDDDSGEMPELREGAYYVTIRAVEGRLYYGDQSVPVTEDEVLREWARYCRKAMQPKRRGPKTEQGDV